MIIELVKDLLLYEETGKASPLLKSAERSVGKKDLRLISINILNWLRLEYKRLHIWKRKWMHSKPMACNEKFGWCQSLKRLAEENELFKECFYMEEGRLYYHQNVDEETRNKARQLAYEEYPPTVICRLDSRRKATD